MATNKWVRIANALTSLLLLGIGVSLFFVRTTRIAHVYDADPELLASPSSPAFISGQYLLLPDKNHIKELNETLASLGLAPSLPLLDWILVTKKSSKHPIIELSSTQAEEDRQIINSLLQHPHILDAQLNFYLSAADNPTLSPSWPFHSKSVENSLELNKAWHISTGSPNVTIAVIDDFIDDTIFHFQARFKECLSRVSLKTPFGSNHKPYFNQSHGELMLLALGACNGIDGLSAGIDQKASLWAVERADVGQAQTMAAALYAAGIDICQESIIPCPSIPSYSLGPKADIIVLPFAHGAPQLLQFFSDTIASLRARKSIIVTSAGNDGKEASYYFPGNIAGVINVGAFNEQGQKSSFSNWGPSVDLYAPGEAIKYIFPPMKKIASGTSLSAAFTAGTIALMKAVNPTLSSKRALAFLQRSASPFTCEEYCAPLALTDNTIDCPALCCAHPDNDCGLFKLNTFKAVQQAQINRIDEGILEIDSSYKIFSRNTPSQLLLIKNVGDQNAAVETLSYDKNILVQPDNFILTPQGSENDHIELSISFHKEPYKHQTSKIEFIVRNKNNKTDRNEVYIEYTTKK